MKQITLLSLCICLNILFTFLLVHKHNQIIKVLHDTQKLQDKIDLLSQEKKKLFYQLHQEQNIQNIATFASDTLKMKPIAIKETKTIHQKKVVYAS